MPTMPTSAAPSVASSSAASVATSAGPSHFGNTTPAAPDAAARSSVATSGPSPLIRTKQRARCSGCAAIQSRVTRRALALRSGVGPTASSRSTMTTSAIDANAFAIFFSSSPGTNSQLRRIVTSRVRGSLLHQRLARADRDDLAVLVRRRVLESTIPAPRPRLALARRQDARRDPQRVAVEDRIREFTSAIHRFRASCRASCR